MFRSADLILFTKTDLLPYFDYDIEKEKMEARKLKPNVDILEVNIKDRQSLQNVIDWINFKRKMRQQDVFILLWFIKDYMILS